MLSSTHYTNNTLGTAAAAIQHATDTSTAAAEANQTVHASRVEVQQVMNCDDVYSLSAQVR